MVKCIVCDVESESPSGWYADLTENGRVMRCPSCGEEEKKIRHDYRYGQKDNKGQDVSSITVDDGFFPPPWNINEHPEKTEGWIEFQKAMRKDPEYYSFQPERSKREDLINSEEYKNASPIKKTEF